MTVQDLTAIAAPFGLLDAEAQAELQAHGGPHEVFTDAGWRDLSSPAFMGCFTYRVRPATKPSIDWSHVAEGFNWLARDEDGEPFLYSHCPYTGSMSWHSNGFMRDARIFASYTPGTCDWKDSLVCRPGYEGDAA